MPHLNRVEQIGRLTRDVEFRTAASGVSVAKFGIANNERKKNASGAWEDGPPNFFDVTCFGWLAEHARDNFTNGMEISLVGKLQYETWDDKTTGAKRSKVGIIAEIAYGVLWKKKEAKQEQPAPEPAEQADPPAGEIPF